MNHDVIITCALTGAGDTASRSPYVPVTPEAIAEDALAAAAAGAAVVHIHVRDPDSGQPSRDPKLFAEVHERIRSRNTDLILNYTGGMGGDLWFEFDDGAALAPQSDFVGARERVQHILELGPEIGSLDSGSLNFGEMVYATTPNILRDILVAYRERGVRPEIEVFELGHIEIARVLIDEGLVPEPPMFQLCLGVKYGAPATPRAMMAMRDALPPGALWAAFGVGRMQFPMVAQAVLLGGHVRVGLEDNLYLDRGILATNAALVERAAALVRDLGCEVASTEGARALLGLPAALTPVASDKS
ncbi:MAG: 3-keto-5-aminohexanoate cleavage protein [Haliea sp.]|uniref:3-keto-5-aminohexanoate cleavage protein n=1 Tax=Haliea sp. TaxID=1932666 RepID=UPI0032ED401C